MGKRSKSGGKSKSGNTKKSGKNISGGSDRTEPVYETRATQKYKARQKAREEKEAANSANSKSAGRSWGFRAVLITAVLAFVSFSFLPALGALKHVDWSSTFSSNRVSVEQLEQAVAKYEEVLVLEPDNESALQGLIGDLFQLGRMPDAIAPLQHLTELEPERVDLALQLGQLQMQTDRSDEGLRTLKAVYEAHPTRTDVLETLVNAEILAGKPQTAIARLEAKVKEGDGFVATSLLLAQAYRAGDRFDDAIGVYDRLLKSDPEDFRPAFEKALMLSNASEDKRNFGEAQTLFELAEDLAPNQTGDRIREIAKGYRAYAADLAKQETETNTDVEKAE
ncbi:MAG: tetratricopeptide repeat protein [Synechococcus sp.]